MNKDNALESLEDEAARLRASIEILRLSERMLEQVQHRVHADNGLAEMRNRLLVVERRISSLRFGPPRLM